MSYSQLWSERVEKGRPMISEEFISRLCTSVGCHIDFIEKLLHRRSGASRD